MVAYDPAWPGEFDRLRRRVTSALNDRDAVVEHVGSTAVPGLDAKPIIDADVVVSADVEVGPVVGALADAGWRPQGDLGIAGREAFEPPAAGPYHHLYVVVAGSRAYRDHIDLRDYLRLHPAEASRYAALKHRLAPLLVEDREGYVDGKAVLILEFLDAARNPP